MILYLVFVFALITLFALYIAFINKKHKNEVNSYTKKIHSLNETILGKENDLKLAISDLKEMTKERNELSVIHKTNVETLGEQNSLIEKLQKKEVELKEEINTLKTNYASLEEELKKEKELNKENTFVKSNPIIKDIIEKVEKQNAELNAVSPDTPKVEKTSVKKKITNKKIVKK